MSSHTLEYFDVAGRADAIRIAFHAAEVEFTDKRFTFQEWQGFKAETTDWTYKNGLPVLTVDGQKFTQSLALLRYAGRKGKLYPEDAVQAMRVDEVMDINQDILAKTPSPPDAEEKKKQREAYGAGKMLELMSRLQQLAEESTTGWIAGTKDMSIADLVVYGLLFMIRKGDFDHIQTDYSDKFGKLVGLEKAVPEHPAVKAYYASRQ